MNVLLVDDSRAMRLLIMRAMRSTGMAEMNFFEASNGVEAIEEFSRRSHDLLITDLHMGELDGITLIRMLKADHPYTPCGVVTGEAHPGVLAEATRAGALFIVRKPFTVDDWAQALQPLRSRRRP